MPNSGVPLRESRSANFVTRAVGIVVSESSLVRLFCHGQLVGEIIPEVWMMDHAQLGGTVKREQVGELCHQGSGYCGFREFFGATFLSWTAGRRNHSRSL